jgi:tRNA A-37 threonylcarbamoyl transferase component Bud32
MIGSEDNSLSGIDSYAMGELIGQGGFSKVYKAEHRYIEKQACIKIIRSDHQSENLDSLLVREAQVLTKLDHTNIVRVIDLAIKDDQIYLIMDYIDGGDLAAHLKSASGSLTVEEVDRIISQIASGLHYMHQKQVIHRDLKPQNILCGKNGRVVIADFGLAKVLDNALSQTTRSLGFSRAGTKQYMAPEHLEGKPEYRSDLYSLGVIAYQLLTNRLPFTSYAMHMGHLQQDPPPLREFNPKLTPEIERVVHKMLENEPEKRYQNALDFARDLHRAIIHIALKPMRTDPERFRDDLENIAEDRAMILGPGDYVGSFTLDKRLHLIGTGQSTRLRALDEPVLHIRVSGVQLENLLIQRTRESDDEAVIQAEEPVSYILRHVTIEGGRAEGATWEDAEWQLPVNGINLGRIPVESQQSREVPIEAKEWCRVTVKSNLPGLEVFPARLPPGPHTLKLEFNASGGPPGTHLDGSVHLEGESESREIHVTGQIEEPVLLPTPASVLAEEHSLTQMEWVYQLLPEAAQNLLRELGDAEEKSLVAQWKTDRRNRKLKRQMRDSASNLLFELVGRKACRWYVRRLRVNENEQYPDEEIWELVLAIDGPNFPSILSKRKKTLRLECRILRSGKETLKVSKVTVLDQDKGVENLVALSALVRLASFVPDYQGIPSEFIEQIQDLPIKSADNLDENQQKGWQDWLDFQSEQIKKRQYWVGYNRHTYREGASKITFFLDKENTRNGAQELIAYKEFQDLVRKSKKEWLKMFTTLPAPSKPRKRNDRIIGSVERFHPEAGTLEIKLEQKMAARLRNGYVLPWEGYLYFEAGGDISQIERYQDALDFLQEGRATNPLLGDFFFDSRKARPIEAIQQLLPADLLSGTCNSGQIAAIEAALATRDLLLIQGPPGTGKTTVIAEICYQVALNGGRTLIASQSNLAVDNALGRIIHHPRVRALRKGNLETVEYEGRDYTEEQVVQKWLSNTAHDCKTKLENRRENITLFRRLLCETERFALYRASEVTWENKLLSLQRKQAAVIQEIKEIEDSFRRNEEEEKKCTSAEQAMSALLTGEIIGRAETNGALQDVFQYLFADVASRLHFRNQVNDGLQIVKQVGLIPPAGGHLLMCLVWLKETVHIHNAAWTESRQRIDQAGEEITQLNEIHQLQLNLLRSIQSKKGQMQDILAQIDNLQSIHQYLTSEVSKFQRATTAVNSLPQKGSGSIAAAFLTFLNEELSKQRDRPFQLARLEAGKVFPPEILSAIQRNTSIAFLGKWDGVEKSIRGRIQGAVGELEEYTQDRNRLKRCQQYFQQALEDLPEMRQELGKVQPGLTPIRQGNRLSHLISLIENNLNSIYEIRGKTPSLIDRLFNENERRLLTLFRETRDLGMSADKLQERIPYEINTTNNMFVENIAAHLSSFLQQWLSEQQVKAMSAHEAALQKKDQLEAEFQRIQGRCIEEEAQLAEVKRACDSFTQRLTDFFQELSRCVSIPEALRKVALQNASSTANAQSFIEEFQTVCQRWVSDIQRLETLVNELWGELQATGGKVQQWFAQTRAVLEERRHRLSVLRSELETLEASLQHESPTLLCERRWWSNFWETIPEHLRPLRPPEGIFALPLLEAVEKQFKTWGSELAREEYVAQRYDRLIADWVTDLRNLSEDEKRKLQDVYIKNANAIGITCGQAPKLTPRELRTFASFDTIIIDEVSKATAPELLLPAIKGKKLILIGDQHQLPPMIEDKTFVQMAEETGKDPQEYGFLNRSYFKDRYNEAPDAIKRMLSIQYRMHPDIMAAINQFYERPLQCGLNQPDIERDHRLESALVRKNRHLIWVAPPLVSAHAQKQRSQTILLRNKTSGREVFRYQSTYNSFGEEADGTSYKNYREVEIIEKICEEFQRIWALKKAAGAERKEIGVITFYAAQEKLLYDHLLSRNGNRSRFDALNIRVGTVDRFQGMERAVIIVSMVRNNSQRDIGFARRDERINVAFSRAQELLVIVGCHDLFCSTARYEDAVERYNNVSKIVEKRGDFIDVSPIQH